MACFLVPQWPSIDPYRPKRETGVLSSFSHLTSWSGLSFAASGARLKTFKYVYEIDPNVDVVTTAGNTIMHVAVGLNGRSQPEVCEVIQFLADHGAKLDEMNAVGRTPIAVADGLPVDLAVDLLTKLITARGEKPKIPSKR